MTGSSVKTRLLIWLLPALTLLVIAAAVGLYSLQRQLLFQEFDQQLGRRAFAASRLLWRPRGPSTAEPTQAAEGVSPEGLLFIELWDLDSGTLRTALPADHEAGGSPIVAVPGSRRPAHSSVTLRDGRKARVFAMRMPAPPRRPRRGGDGQREPTSAQGEPTDAGSPGPHDEAPEETPTTEAAEETSARRSHGDRLYIAAADLAPLRADLRQWASGLLFACAGSIAIVVVVVLVGVNRGLRPLRSVAADIATIDAGHLAQRIGTPDVPKEMRPVVRQLNDLLDRLQGAFERERAFLAAAAHELRTPLAGVRSQIEVCLRRSRSADDYRHTLEQCLETAVSVQQIVNSLLQVSRPAGRQEPPTAERVDAARILAEQRDRLDDHLRRRRLRLKWEVPDSLPMETDRQLLRGIASNLLSNAATYADEGTWIAVAACQDGHQVHLQVSNPARDMRPSDLGRMFEPFWRRDEARSDAGTHAGVGLTIVQQAVTALGGSIRPSLSEDGVLQLDLHLPRGLRAAD